MKINIPQFKAILKYHRSPKQRPQESKDYGFYSPNVERNQDKLISQNTFKFRPFAFVTQRLNIMK